MIDYIVEVLDAHGGLDAWNKVRSLEVEFNFFGGLLELKGFPGHHKPTATVDAVSPRVAFRGFGRDQNERWIFTPETAWIESDQGELVEQRENPRSAFAGHERSTPWDRLHLTYFLGYALWNYLTTPFLFTRPGFEFKELGEHEEAGETWRVIEVTYPDDIPAHCKVQKVYFDESHMLKRLDYVTDVLGGVAAHYCFDPMPFGGIVIPTLRRVVRRTPQGPLVSGRTSFILDYINVKVAL